VRKMDGWPTLNASKVKSLVAGAVRNLLECKRTQESHFVLTHNMHICQCQVPTWPGRNMPSSIWECGFTNAARDSVVLILPAITISGAHLIHLLRYSASVYAFCLFATGLPSTWPCKYSASSRSQPNSCERIPHSILEIPSRPGSRIWKGSRCRSQRADEVGTHLAGSSGELNEACALV